MNRTNNIDRLRENPEISVLIIGAGVNGVGLFRELALQDIDVVLVDEGDFCTGATIAVSHLVHGDVYYRENGGFGPAQTAVTERQRLLRIAPHVIVPMPTTVPIFRWVSGRFHFPLKLPQEVVKTGRRGIFFTRLGLMLQDKLLESKGGNFKHKFAFRKKSLQQFPRLNPDILGTVSYYNATITNPERLCLDLLWDARNASSHAIALNYIDATQVDDDTVTLTNSVTGESLQLYPQLLINAQDCPHPSAKTILQRGLHLVLNNNDLRQAISNQSIFFEHEDGRFIRIFPDHHHVLISTTAAEKTKEDTQIAIADTLQLVKQLFPTIVVNSEDIVYLKSECQPLTPADGTVHLNITKAGTRAQYPIIHLHGGSWTTFRSNSTKIAHQILAAFGKKAQQSTDNLAIGGGKRFPYDRDERWRWFHKQAREYDLAFEHVKLLFNRYGTRAREVAAFLAAEPDTPLQHHPDYTRREIVFLAFHEQVVHLDDLILRRTTIGKLGEATAEFVAELAHIVAQTLHWSPEREQTDIDRTLDILVEQHTVPQRLA